MSLRLIEERILQYQPTSKREELNALKEIVQEITLYALGRAKFFKISGFQGETCLRILYGLPRFSEDLDFILFEEAPQFRWRDYFREIQLEFEAFGLSLELKDRSELDNSVKKAFLKENSFGKVLQLIYPRNRSDEQKIQIKLEVDTHPPSGSQFESKIVEFPTPFSLTAQTLPSLFAGKLHALLCREYVKGRDWYDFVWYVTRRTAVNYDLLQASLVQQGPWANQKIGVQREWLLDTLKRRVKEIDWESARRDVEPFIKPKEHEAVSLWSAPFFEHFIDKIE